MVSFHGIARVIPKGSVNKRYYYMRVTIKLRRYPESIAKMARIAPPSYVPGKDTRAGRFGKFVYEGSKAKYLMEQAWPYLEPRRKKQYLRNYVVMQARNSIARADREGRRRRALQEALIAQKRTSAEAQRRRELLYHNQDPAIQVIMQERHLLTISMLRHTDGSSWSKSQTRPLFSSRIRPRSATLIRGRQRSTPGHWHWLRWRASPTKTKRPIR